MTFSPEFLDELRERAGLAQVVGRKVRLTRHGREYKGLCPFHGEKTPSFTVSEEKGFYHCFGCGAHGSAIDFVMKADGLSFPEAVERLARDAGMELPAQSPEAQDRERQRQSLFPVLEAAAVWFERGLRMPEGRAAMDYVLGRGLEEATIARFRIGFAPDSRGALKSALGREGFGEDVLVKAGLLVQPEDRPQSPYDRFRGRVMFPIVDRRGRVVAFGGRVLGDGEPKYLNSPETEVFHKGRTLYGLNHALAPARERGTLVVVEGYMDVIALHQAGYPHTVAPLGTALTEEQMQELWRVVPEPTLCFDGDAAGVGAAVRAAERALPLVKANATLRFAFIARGEDPDSLVKTYRSEFMRRTLADSYTLSETLWRLESGGTVPKTPEARAQLEKRLKDHGRRIADAAMRRHFLDDVYERLWRAPRRAAREGAGGRAEAPRLDAKSATERRIDSLDQVQRVLLAVAVNHPRLFDRIGEELGSLHFPDAGLDALRQALIDILSARPAATREEVEAALRDRGLADGVELVFRDPLVRAHRLVRADASVEDAIEAWTDSARALREAALAEEARHLNEALKGDIDAGNWEQLRARKSSTLEDAER